MTAAARAARRKSPWAQITCAGLESAEKLAAWGRSNRATSTASGALCRRDPLHAWLLRLLPYIFSGGPRHRRAFACVERPAAGTYLGRRWVCRALHRRRRGGRTARSLRECGVPTGVRPATKASLCAMKRPRSRSVTCSRTPQLMSVPIACGTTRSPVATTHRPARGVRHGSPGSRTRDTPCPTAGDARPANAASWALACKRREDAIDRHSASGKEEIGTGTAHMRWPGLRRKLATRGRVRPRLQAGPFLGVTRFMHGFPSFSRASSTAALVIAALSLGCDESVSQAAGDPPREKRGLLGKADAAGSCANDDGDFCGGQSAGACWCDTRCAQFGDCCRDLEGVCGREPAQRIADQCGAFDDGCGGTVQCDDGGATSCEPRSTRLRSDGSQATVADGASIAIRSIGDGGGRRWGLRRTARLVEMSGDDVGVRLRE